MCIYIYVYKCEYIYIYIVFFLVFTLLLLLASPDVRCTFPWLLAPQLDVYVLVSTPAKSSSSILHWTIIITIVTITKYEYYY